MNKFHQHWKLKALAQKALWVIPGGIYLNAFASKLRAGHSAEYELFKKHAPNYIRHLSRLREQGFEIGSDKSFLEIGTGWDVNIAYLARLTGFRDVTTVDAFRHVQPKQIEACVKLFPQLAKQLAAEFALDEETLTSEFSVAAQIPGIEFCKWANINYIAPISKDYREVASASCDLAYSTAVFEHIYVDDVITTIAQIRRVLKPGGLTSHVIDLKDHFAYFQPGLPYNHCLRFTDKQWRFWAGNPMSFTNRLLASDWEKLFQDAGLEIVYFEELVERNIPRLDNNLLSDQFKHRNERDLTIGELHVIAKRPL